MAKVEFNHLVESVHGKVCNDPRGPIFAQRKDTGSKYVYHRDNPYTGPATEAQEAQKQRFKAASTNTKNVMNNPEQLTAYKEAWRKNPGKYGTLRGYIFAQEMAKLMV